MAKKRLKLGRAYWVEWLDAYSGENSWETEADIAARAEEDYIVWTMGWLQQITDKYYVFCSTVVKDATYRSATFHIPKGMVINIKEATYDT